MMNQWLASSMRLPNKGMENIMGIGSIVKWHSKEKGGIVIHNGAVDGWPNLGASEYDDGMVSLIRIFSSWKEDAMVNSCGE